jgi:hypothetical protein
MPKFAPKPKPPPEPVDEVSDPLAALLARCDELRDDIDTYVNKLAAAEKVNAPGVPVDMIRQTLTKGSACSCSVVKRFVDDIEEVKARRSATEAEQARQRDGEIAAAAAERAKEVPAAEGEPEKASG